MANTKRKMESNINKSVAKPKENISHKARSMYKQKESTSCGVRRSKRVNLQQNQISIPHKKSDIKSKESSSTSSELVSTNVSKSLPEKTKRVGEMSNARGTKRSISACNLPPPKRSRKTKTGRQKESKSAGPKVNGNATKNNVKKPSPLENALPVSSTSRNAKPLNPQKCKSSNAFMPGCVSNSDVSSSVRKSLTKKRKLNTVALQKRKSSISNSKNNMSSNKSRSGKSSKTPQKGKSKNQTTQCELSNESGISSEQKSISATPRRRIVVISSCLTANNQRRMSNAATTEDADVDVSRVTIGDELLIDNNAPKEDITIDDEDDDDCIIGDSVYSIKHISRKGLGEIVIDGSSIALGNAASGSCGMKRLIGVVDHFLKKGLFGGRH